MTCRPRICNQVRLHAERPSPHPEGRPTGEFDNLRDALKLSEKRLAELEQERRPLLVEAEFYKNKPMPPKLKSKLEYIEVAADAQRTLVVNQQAELVRINGLYDEELARLRKLWDGALPGTVGPVPAAVTGAKKG